MTLLESTEKYNVLLDELKGISSALSKLPKKKIYFRTPVISGVGVLGYFQQKKEMQRMKEFFETQIYDGLTYDEIGFLIVKKVEQLCECVKTIQDSLSHGDPDYFSKIEPIVHTFEETFEKYHNVSPDACEFDLQLNEGGTLNLYYDLPKFVYSKITELDLPIDNSYVQNKVKRGVKGESKVSNWLRNHYIGPRY